MPDGNLYRIKLSEQPKEFTLISPEFFSFCRPYCCTAVSGIYYSFKVHLSPDDPVLTWQEFFLHETGSRMNRRRPG
jgi:hypothetical protein